MISSMLTHITCHWRSQDLNPSPSSRVLYRCPVSSVLPWLPLNWRHHQRIPVWLAYIRSSSSHTPWLTKHCDWNRPSLPPPHPCPRFHRERFFGFISVLNLPRHFKSNLVSVHSAVFPEHLLCWGSRSTATEDIVYDPKMPSLPRKTWEETTSRALIGTHAVLCRLMKEGYMFQAEIHTHLHLCLSGTLVPNSGCLRNTWTSPSSSLPSHTA